MPNESGYFSVLRCYAVFLRVYADLCGGVRFHLVRVCVRVSVRVHNCQWSCRCCRVEYLRGYRARKKELAWFVCSDVRCMTVLMILAVPSVSDLSTV